MRVFTAQEMREAANAVDQVSVNGHGEYFYEKHEKFNPDIVRDMLRQAASDLERAKKYEYSFKSKCGFISATHANSFEMIEETKILDSITVRRTVGDWEEVKER